MSNNSADYENQAAPGSAGLRGESAAGGARPMASAAAGTQQAPPAEQPVEQAPTLTSPVGARQGAPMDASGAAGPGAPGLPGEAVSDRGQADSGGLRPGVAPDRAGPASGPSGAEEAVVMESVIIEDEAPARSGGAYPDAEARAPGGGASAEADSPDARGASPAQGVSADQIQERWVVIQSAFVDDPRGAVGAAAQLVSEAIAMLVASAQERERSLRGEWDRDGADTEVLRTALKGYRAFLDRLAAL